MAGRVFHGDGRWWSLPAGPRNAITDVSGVSVGHATLRDGGARTGVTAILPQPGDLYRAPVVAGAAILNGFGKSAGLMQLVELGEIETPILLTNTMAVPVCSAELVRLAVADNPGIGRGNPSVNALVLECNDGVLNDMQNVAVTGAHVRAAIASASAEVAQGTVGAGTGMRSFGLAGGIGTASRSTRVCGEAFTLGTLVLSNFGLPAELRVLGRRVVPPDPARAAAEHGSIIIVMATDAPLSSRQLTRLAHRAGPGLGQLGSFLGHGSGDVAVAFSTANRLTRAGSPDSVRRLPDAELDPVFLAAVETVEEAVLNALWHAEAAPGYDGTVLPTLKGVLATWAAPRRTDAIPPPAPTKSCP
jgi:D-aminopeptidase